MCSNPLTNRAGTRTIVFSILCLIANLTVDAQITITSADFPHTGMLVVREVDSTTTVSPGGSGINQVWDFSNLSVSYTDSVLYLPPAGLPGSQNYPAANLVEKDMNVDANYEGSYNYIYHQSTPGGWYNLGQELRVNFWGLSFFWHMFVDPPALTLPLPCTYGTTNNQEFHWMTYSSSWYGGTQADTSLVANYMSVEQTADGSGIIITPAGSFDALRVFEHITGIDSVFNYDPSLGWIFDHASYSEFDSYRWFANGIGEVGQILDTGKKSGNGFAYFKSSTLVGINESVAKEPWLIYPVPAGDRLFVIHPERIIRIEVYDLAGKLKCSETGTGSIDISRLEPGIYLSRIYSDSETVTNKFVKQ